MTKEKELRITFYNLVAPFFNIISGGLLPEKEISKGNRPDFMMFHKSDTSRDYRFVIEAKKSEIKKGTEIHKWLCQAQRYKVDKKTFVFTLPRVSGWFLSEGERVKKHDLQKQHHCNVATFIYAAYGIGQVISYKNGSKSEIKFILRDKCIWDSRTNFLNTTWLNIL